MILKFNVKEQTISLVNTKSVPRIGSKDYLVLQFSFSSDWENLNKLVYLQSGDVSQPINIVDNLVEVPEWFTEQDSFNVTLFGTDGTTEVPTNVVSVQLEKSNDLWVKDAPEPQPSWLVSVLDAAELVKEATVHGPTIGSNGNWYTWDFESKQYIDTGVVASGSSGTTDHTQLTNRDAENQHPMSAITGLLGALGGKVSVADIINNLTTNASNKPLSAAQGVALKALIDAIRIPEKLPNPNALTFTGAVEGSYDGSAAKTINIPSGGGEPEYDYEKVIVLDEAVTSYIIDTFDDGTPLALSSLEVISVTTNKTAATVSVNILTDLPNSVNAGKLNANTIGGYTGAEKWMYFWLEAKIKNGECRADFASAVNLTRYINFYSGISSNNSFNHIKHIPAITFSNDTTEIFPNKATKFMSVEISVPAGSMESGSMIRIRGVKA